MFPKSLFILTLIGAVAFIQPSPARADATQLCRSFTTIVLAPTDILFGPVIAGQDMMVGFEDQDDGWLQVLVGTIPGYLILNYLQVGGATLRIIAGAFEFLPGLATLPTEQAPKPLFTSQDEAEAMVSTDLGPCPIRIGVHYNTVPWG